MFKIGEFARVGQVTVEALRHYDALDLLKPAHVDPFTGYRYYTAAQLGALNRILALKELGFSLEVIGRLLRDDLAPAVFRELLAARLAATAREVGEAQARLARVRTRLYLLEAEEPMAMSDVVLKTLEPLTIAAKRETVPEVAQMPDRCAAMFGAIARWLPANRLPFGPTLTLYHSQGANGGDIDTECAFVVGDGQAAMTVPASGGVALRRLEGAPQAATIVVTDDFFRQVGGLTPAYQALARWVEANGYALAGTPREMFYGSVAGGDLTAEVQFPVSRLTA